MKYLVMISVGALLLQSNSFAAPGRVDNSKCSQVIQQSNMKQKPAAPTASSDDQQKTDPSKTESGR